MVSPIWVHGSYTSTKAGGIVRAARSEPFGNCMPLPRLLVRPLCEAPRVDFDTLQVASI